MTDRQLVRRAAVAAVAVMVAGCSSPSTSSSSWSTTLRPLATMAASSGSGPRPAANPYFSAPFAVATNRVTFGQDPVWTPDGRVLSNDPDAAHLSQIYLQNLDGSQRTCVTCGKPGPNGFPQANPKGGWVLYGSWRGQKTAIGAPALGGAGTDLFVSRYDGSQDTRLTQIAQAPVGHAEDNYHPYWSPDGRQLVWTHVDFQPVAQGGTRWEIRLADFVVDARGPHLANIRSIGPAHATGFETQAWSPDGRGFLFTQFGDRAHYGFMNSELYFMQVRGGGASPEHPVITHLTDGSPAWDEQAVFTPDGRNVIWMSSRARPSWFESVVSSAQWLDFDSPYDNTIFGALFFRILADPKFKTELYMLDLGTKAVRRLTFDDTVIPEFQFDPGGTRLLWTTGAANATRVGTFDLHGTSGAVTGTPAVLPAGHRPARPLAAAPHGLTPSIFEGPKLLAPELARLQHEIATRITS